MAANPDVLPSNEGCREAMEKAFEEHLSYEWLDDVSEADMREMNRLVWDVVHNVNARANEKYFSIKAIFERYAEKKCRAYADANWPDHMGR